MSFAKIARSTARPEQRDERIAELTPAVQLQRQIELTLLSGTQELEHVPRLAALLGQPGEARELQELVDIGRKPRGDLARPRQADQGHARVRPATPQRAQSRHGAE